MKTAILLLGFNRIDYFQRTLFSLEANNEAHDCDLHVFIDGGPKARQQELIALVKSSSFKNPNFVLREKNWGIGRHLIDARRTLFDKLGYDRILLLEDDMVLAPNYVKTVFGISDWASNYGDVGTVMAYNINQNEPEIQATQINHVISTNRHFWGYVITKKVWDDIKHIIYEFESKYLLKYTYTNRPHRRIRWLFMRKWISRKRHQKPNPMIPTECMTPPFSKLPFRVATSQDAITALALWHHGYSRITTRVSRAEYVGVEGYSFSQEVFENQGFDKQNLIDFDSLNQEIDNYEFIKSDQDGKIIKPRGYE